MDRRTKLAILVGLLFLGHAAAQSPTAPKGHRFPLWSCLNGCPNLGCCPDDYCRKPCPVINPISRCGSPDDYCRKPLPHLCNVPHCGTCNDYCRKPLPTLLCPPLTQYLQCPPPACTHPLLAK
jgi:hypothetical protein